MLAANVACGEAPTNRARDMKHVEKRARTAAYAGAIQRFWPCYDVKPSLA